MQRKGRQNEKCEEYKVTAMSKLMCNYASWTENLWTYIKSQKFKTRNNN